jgi:hypothetical protein
MMARGVSVIVGSRDAALRPSLMRAMAGTLSADRQSVTVYLARTQSRQLLQDIAATGHIAAVFSEPSTHRTVQLKATRASIRNADPSDEPVLARYAEAMEGEITQVGFPADIARAMLASRIDDLVAVTFVPEQAFDQTPGPRAGTRLEAAP